jgi:hypothetical protein
VFDQITKALGLVTQYNSLTTAPGGLARANNCVIRRENVIEDRRGYAVDGTLTNPTAQLMGYQGKVIANQGNLLSYGPSSYVNYAGTYSPPTGLKMRFAEAASNLYLTTSLGIKVLTDVAGTAGRSAGMPRMLDPSYALNAAATGFLTNAFQCAYRCLIQRLDANGSTISGYPSQRLWVPNTAGTPKNIDLTVFLPSEAQIADVVKFYRTAQVAGTSSDIAGDECALVFQYTLTSTDITAGTIAFTDITVDTLRGEALYTNASQQGISQANDRPPVATDIALFKTFMFYSNCATKQRLFLTLVGTSSLTGQTITVAGTTYNFGATEIIAGTPTAAVSATGVAAADIDVTARSLVRVINRYTGNTSVYAYYLSGPTDLPGQILLEERGIGSAAFTSQGSNAAIATMFFPPPPVSPLTSAPSTSSNQIQKNGIYYSKDKQYEHVPTLNYLLVGASNKNILRIVPLRNSLIVIKEEGVYRVTGDTPANFISTPLDLTVFCKAANSVAALSNQVFMLSNQGIVSISENGVQVVSREISNLIIPLLQNTNLLNLSYGIGYESEGWYLFSSITNASDTTPNQTLIYNIYTKAWVRWTFGFACALVEANTDKLYFAQSSSSIVYVERKSFTDLDFADPELAVTISAISGFTVTLTTSGAAPQVGWAINEQSTSIAILAVVTNNTNPVSYTLTLATAPPGTWITGAALMYPSVGMDWEYLPWVGGNAGAMKQVRAYKILVDSVAGTSTETSLIASFHSNLDDQVEEVVIPQSGSGWGSAWGSMPWGGGGDSYGYSTFVPRNKQYCARLMLGGRHPNALEKVSVIGIAIEYENISGTIGR